MINIFHKLDKLHDYREIPILIEGRTGTGKEVIAKYMHYSGLKEAKPFVAINCAAIPEPMFESELFGYVKGAFTDANESRPGRFEIASGGTLFLDEIGNLDISMQSKLLSVLQNNEITRVGSNSPIPIDVRIICATNRSLYQMVEEGEFRQDLLYRINTVEITLPPLRDRSEDIPLLAFHYLRLFRKKYNKPSLQISEEALKQLCAYPWPGNIRELRHSVERAVIMGENDHLIPEDFNLGNQGAQSTLAFFTGKIDDIEKAAIQRALNKGAKSMAQVALAVGLSRSTLYRKMKKYGL